MQELKIPEWTWSDELEVPIRVIATGKTNSGKSYFVRWLLYLLCDRIDELYVMCPTMGHGDWEDLTSKGHIWSEFNEEVLDGIIEAQKKKAMEGVMMKQILILLDDCIFSFKKNDAAVSTLFVKGRHWNISVCVVSQKFRLLNNAIRANADIIVVTRVVNQHEKMALYEEYNNGVGRDSFFNLIDRATMDKGVLVIDNIHDEEQLYFKSKAPGELPLFYIEEKVGKRGRVEREGVELKL